MRNDAVAVVAFDYHFFGIEGAHAADWPTLVMVDINTGNRWARMLPAKGVTGNPWLVREVSEELRAWGRMGQGAPRFVLRSDGEVGLRSVRDCVADFVQAQVVTETSPPGESAANGAA